MATKKNKEVIYVCGIDNVPSGSKFTTEYLSRFY